MVAGQPRGWSQRHKVMRTALAVVVGIGLALSGCAEASAPSGQQSSSAPGTPPPASVSRAPCSARQDRVQLGYQAKNALTGVQFVSPNRGWVVGMSQILATSDAGRHWTVQESGRLDLASVDFVDDQHGWAVGANSLLATSDGGAHWTALPEPCPMIRQVHFVSPLAGFAIAGGIDLTGLGLPTEPLSDGSLLATSDGGRSWRRLPARAGAQSVCFDTASVGWLGARGALYRTIDGGRSWNPTAAQVRPPNPDYPAFMQVQCAGSGAAWATAIGPGAGMSQEPHVGFQIGRAHV